MYISVVVEKHEKKLCCLSNLTTLFPWWVLEIWDSVGALQCSKLFLYTRDLFLIVNCFISSLKINQILWIFFFSICVSFDYFYRISYRFKRSSLICSGYSLKILLILYFVNKLIGTIWFDTLVIFSLDI